MIKSNKGIETLIHVLSINTSSLHENFHLLFYNILINTMPIIMQNRTPLPPQKKKKCLVMAGNITVMCKNSFISEHHKSIAVPSIELRSLSKCKTQRFCDMNRATDLATPVNKRLNRF